MLQFSNLRTLNLVESETETINAFEQLCSMPAILAIETSGTTCSVALFREDQMTAFREIEEPNAHSRLLFQLIREVLSDSSINLEELNALAFSSGPGSYTGLRIGCSAVKGLGYARELPVICISSLEVICRGFLETSELPDDARIAVMIDARRQEVFTGFFDAKARILAEPGPYILTENPPSFAEDLTPLYVIGNGAEKARALGLYPKAQFYGGNYLSARFMGQAAQEYLSQRNFADLAYFEPDYLKPFFFQGKST